MKNILKQISVWICAFFIVSASFFLGFSCSLMSYEYYKDINIASASIVEEDYDVSSNAVDYPYEFWSNSYAFYRLVNNINLPIFVSLNLIVDMESSAQYCFEVFSQTSTTRYLYQGVPGVSSYSRFNTSATSFLVGNASNGVSLGAYNFNTFAHVSSYDIYYRVFMYNAGFSNRMGQIVSVDYGLFDSNEPENLVNYNWLSLFSGSTMVCAVFNDEYNNSFGISIALNGLNSLDLYRNLGISRYYLYDKESNGYDIGFEHGKSEGIYLGRQEGYSDGFRNGKAEGRQIGFDEGVESANTYSFLGFFGAIIDAPVRAFTSLFDYELLGFNIKSFLMALLTCSIVIWLIKVVTGKAGG